MESKPLKNAPLVEAIFQVKWQLRDIGPGLQADPNYSLSIGGIYQELRDTYPVHEQLPTASIPNEMAAGIGIAQHRFRRGKDQCPLVQLGPGILTVNDTEGYEWSDFKERATKGVKTLCKVYPDGDDLNIKSIVLRYINALEFDFDQHNVLEFLKDQLKIDVSLHTSLFEDTTVTSFPLEVDIRSSFQCSQPKGVIRLRLTRGKRDQKDALVWEMIFDARGKDVPELPAQLGVWLDEAHNIIEDWFFKLIEGDLEKRFE